MLDNSVNSESVEELSEKKIFAHPTLNERRSIDGFAISYRMIYDNQVFQNSIHFHEYFELELVCGGPAYHILNGKTITIDKGDIYILRKNDFHTFRFDKDSPIAVFTVHFFENNISAMLVNRIFRNEGPVMAKLDEPKYNTVFELLKMLQHEFRQPNENFPVIQKSLLNAVITILLMNTSNTNNIPNFEKNRTMQRALNYIDSNFLDPMLALSDVSEHLNLTSNHLGQIIKNEIGMSFSQYLKQRRLDYSLQLLNQNLLNISEVAKHSGFNSTAYYISQFKKYYGLPPKQYIAENKPIEITDFDV